MNTIFDCEVLTQCPFCGETHIILVNEIDYLDWKDGKLAQNAFSYLSADEREMLISGICPTCWADTFSGTEEEDDYWEDDKDDLFEIYDLDNLTDFLLNNTMID